MVILMVLIWLALLGLTILGYKRLDGSFGWCLISAASGVFLFFALVMWPVSYYGTKSGIVQYHALVETIEQSRQSEISDIERAALTIKIFEANMQIASCQYWNKTIFDIYIPDEVMELKMLK